MLLDKYALKLNLYLRNHSCKEKKDMCMKTNKENNCIRFIVGHLVFKMSYLVQ